MTPQRSLAQTVAFAEVLARGLSHGRRTGCRPMSGAGRGHATDLHCVFVPWPLPEAESDTTLACAIALQCAPSKELVAQLPLAYLNARERLALQIVEAQEAIAWAMRNWPGLRVTLRESTAAIEPVTEPTLDARALLARACALAATGQSLQLPAMCGQLPLTQSARNTLAARRSQLESRLPWAGRKRMQRLNGWSLAIGGGGEVAGRLAAASANDDEERLLDDRGAHTGIPYPEWNVHAQCYREQHVRVVETRLHAGSAPAHAVDPRLAAWFEQPLVRGWRHRLDDGSDIDIDAIMEARSDELAAIGNRSDVARCYRERLPAARDTACALLIDRSGSLAQADLLRHEIACANALAAAMHAGREKYAVFTFWSDTRAHVAVEVLRDFHDGQRLQIDPGRVAPRGYTRLGGALRHVAMRLREVEASRRALLVLGDAIPCDEGYEGHYAAADVAKAVEEVEMHGVSIAFVAVGRSSRDSLDEVLRGRLHRVASVAALAPVLADLHYRMAG